MYTNDVSAIFFIIDISLCTYDSFLQTVTALKHGNAAIQMFPAVGKKMVDKGSWEMSYVSGIPREAEGKERQRNGRTGKNNSIHLFRTAVFGGL